MTFSVIVPTFNRLASLRSTLESLFTQDFGDFEIIVVNDGSRDGTGEYLEGLAAGGKILYHCHPNAGLAASRLAGLRIASGTYVAFTDDDCILPSDWLSRLHRDFQIHPVACVGGAARPDGRSRLVARSNDLINNFFKDDLNGKGDRIPFITGNNAAFRADILRQVGGPDPRFRMGAEDRDLITRIVLAGGRIHYDPDILVDHRNEAGLGGFLRHQFEQGKGSALYYRLYPRGTRGSFSIPPRSYLRLLVHPFRREGPLRATGLALLTVCAQAAVAAGYLFALLRSPGSARSSRKSVAV